MNAIRYTAPARLLHWLMTEEGFAGHPDEWWHFSWGDQMWAALTGAPSAPYGLAPISTLNVDLAENAIRPRRG